MPKFFSDTTVFSYSWDQVAQGFWKRYPNPNSKHVLSEDTVQREVRSGKLFSKRLLSKTSLSSLPKWAERFVTAKNVNIVEETIVDPGNRVLVSYTRNLGYAKVMSVTEKVVYTESEEYPGKTVALRYAWIDSQIKGFSRAICAFGYERFKKNCCKMAGGFNYVLSNLYPHYNNLPSTHATIKAATKLKDAAKNASELAKSKAAPIYASLHPNQS
ncbi:preli-like [Leptinotarsa decemlineata]|uniref:preli-like n=1 Tax=Leptinotarsa decemlineata TaxID=7539 RepID=UPI000C25302C|nr:protein preli-like [Leptinotarsa decemlineata]XP_023021436.1 protein preli-like [Leptinotarsa decemlineata]